MIITDPGEANSKRITIEKIVPITPANAPKIIYNVPISLWLVENKKRDIQGYHLVNKLLLVEYLFIKIKNKSKTKVKRTELTIDIFVKKKIKETFFYGLHQ